MNLAIKNLATRQLSPTVTAYYRSGTSDQDALEEVIDRHAYARSRFRSGFDVKAGEMWLDLGANIGAFALYCRLKGARAICYEPEPTCFSILEKNAGEDFILVNKAVTNRTDNILTFYGSKTPTNHYRSTIIPVGRYQKIGQFYNVHASKMKGRNLKYDGIKMDIEGSEFGLIDEWLLPETKKLVMEYHISRDRSWKNLDHRLRIIKKHFEHVKYPKVLDDYIKLKGDLDIWFDQIVFAWN